jgi:hypothetical protein
MNTQGISLSCERSETLLVVVVPVDYDFSVSRIERVP